MAKKPTPEKPAPSSLLPGFQHLIPSAAAAPLAAHIRPLFLPDLVQQIAHNKQIDANRREQAHPAFRKWAEDLKQGVSPGTSLPFSRSGTTSTPPNRRSGPSSATTPRSGSTAARSRPTTCTACS